jgi:hypothetical protein
MGMSARVDVNHRYGLAKKDLIDGVKTYAAWLARA